MIHKYSLTQTPVNQKKYCDKNAISAHFLVKVWSVDGETILSDVTLSDWSPGLMYLINITNAFGCKKAFFSFLKYLLKCRHIINTDWRSSLKFDTV